MDNQWELAKDAIQAGMYLAGGGVSMNSPDVENVVVQSNFIGSDCVTFSEGLGGVAVIRGTPIANIDGQLYLLTSLSHKKYHLRFPIVVHLQQQGDEWIANFSDAKLSRAGATPADALERVKISMVELYEMYRGEARLGPLPQRQFRALGRYLVQKSHSK